MRTARLTVVAVIALLVACQAQPSPDTERSVSVEDPRGDAAAGYIDLLSFVARPSGDDVTFVAELAVAPPVNRSALDEEITYLVAVSTGGQSSESLWLTLENRESGEWQSQLSDFDPPSTIQGEALWSGATFTGRVPLAGLGRPSTVFVCVEAQTTDPATLTTLNDALPGDDCLGSDGARLDIR